MAPDTPVPFLEIHKGLGAQVFGDERGCMGSSSATATILIRCVRSLYGEYLLRTLGDTIARAGAASMADARV